MRFKYKSRVARMVAVWAYALVMAFVTLGIFFGVVAWNFVKLIFYAGWSSMTEYAAQLRNIIEVNDHD